MTDLKELVKSLRAQVINTHNAMMQQQGALKLAEQLLKEENERIAASTPIVDSTVVKEE